MNFKLFLELFDNPLPIQWQIKSGGHWAGSFKINRKEYDIDFDHHDGVTDVSFTLMKPKSLSSHGITGTGDEIPVFATVANAVGEYVEKVYPRIIKFLAKEPSRVRLYRAMLDRYVKPKGYRYTLEDTMFGQEFVAIASSPLAKR